MIPIETTIREMRSEIKEIKAMLQRQNDEWISEADAMKYTGYSKSRLDALRLDKSAGIVYRKSGYKIQFKKTSLDNLFQ